MEDEDIQTYCKKIATAWDNDHEQRDECNADLRFCNTPGGMWEGWLNDVYQDRVRLEFDITAEYVNGFVGEWKDNRAGIYFSPDDDSTQDEDADLLTGIYRADFNDNDGKISVDTAVEETAECGIGHFKMLTRFEDEENPEDERQKVCWEAIPNSFNYVVWDDNARRIDKADALWGAVLTPYSVEAYDDTFPDAETKGSAFEPSTRSWLDWGVVNDQIIVAEYYELEQKAVDVHVYQHIEQNEVKAFTDEDLKDIKDELTEDGWEFVRTRKMNKQTVTKSVFNSKEYLVKPERIPGKYIPIIPMFGFRKYIDGKERFRGLVRKLKDPNRVFNMSMSRVAESSAASPDRVPIFLEEQVKRHSANWADKTDKAYQLLDKVLDGDGNLAVTGPVGYVEPTPLDPNTVAAIDMTARHVQSVTGNMPQDQIDPDASGKAINALIKRENRKTFIITDNINISMEHSGRVYLSIAEEIYADEMSKRTMSEDGSEGVQRINQPVFDRDTGRMVVGETISGKRFKVSARIGPQYETQREATVDTLERVMAMVGPESKYFSALLAMWMKNIEGTGLDEMKEFNRQEMLKMGLTKPETPEEQQMLQIMSQQTDPNDELVRAAAGQQKAETLNLVKSAENKEADTKKKQAETMKIISEVPQRMRFNPETGALDAVG